MSNILVNGKPIKRFNFSAGECQIKIPSISFYKETGVIEIDANLWSSDDIMDLYLTCSALIFGKYIKFHKVIVNLPYFPYSRQDRVCSEGEGDGLRAFFSLLRMMRDTLSCSSIGATLEIHTFDLHSQAYQNFIGKEIMHETTQQELIQKYLYEKIGRESLSMVCPDDGAAKKISGYLYDGILYCKKIRCTETGKILITEVEEQDIKNKNLIIIDDICDGGRTFIEIAKILRERECGKLYLYVTHGIFAKGLDVLRPYFDHIYCYHLIKDYVYPYDHILTVFKEKQNERN